MKILFEKYQKAFENLEKSRFIICNYNSEGAGDI